jgi:NitT/TauT family transport system ATP-binding protein
MRLRVEKVSKVFPQGPGGRDFVALRDVSLEVPSGEFVVVLGPSGCGKSTLLEIIAGLQRPTSGRVFLDEQPIDGPDPRVGIVFQEDSTFSWRTVWDNIGFGLQMRGVPRVERDRAVARMVELVGLEGFERHYPHQLSGGMRQRVAIARTLVMNPALMLMDEPFGALDEQTRFVIGEELSRIWMTTGCTIVFVTHSLHEAIQLGDRIVVLGTKPGRIVRILENSLPRPRRETEDPRRYGELLAELRDAIGLTQAVETIRSGGAALRTRA